MRRTVRGASAAMLRRHTALVGFDVIGGHDPEPAGGGQNGDTRTARRRQHGQALGGITQLFVIEDPLDAVLSESAADHGVHAGQAARMAADRPRAGGGAAGLQHETGLCGVT